MKKYRTFTYIVLSIICGMYALLMTANYIVDPMDIFHSPFLKRNPSTQLRFTKIKYLEAHKEQYNSFLIGSSRIGTTDPALLNKYIPGSSFYNMTVHLANLHEDLLHLQYFVRNNYTVKNIYLQIDVPENMTSYESDPSDFTRQMHPHVFGDSVLPFYLSYLTTKPSTFFRNKLRVNFSKDQSHLIAHDVEGSGKILFVGQDEQIARSPENYIKNEPSFHAKRERTIANKYTKKNIEALQQIKRICEEHEIRLIMFITPHHHKLMDNLVTEDYLDFLRQVAQVGEYWDFSGYNSVTLNDRNYYEASHYREPVSRLVAARIFHDSSINVPQDFGVYVTKENVEKLLETRKAQIQEHDKEQLISTAARPFSP
jgi:hypothetical protein